MSTLLAVIAMLTVIDDASQDMFFICFQSYRGFWPDVCSVNIDNSDKSDNNICRYVHTAGSDSSVNKIRGVLSRYFGCK